MYLTINALRNVYRSSIGLPKIPAMCAISDSKFKLFASFCYIAFVSKQKFTIKNLIKNAISSLWNESLFICVVRQFIHFRRQCHRLPRSEKGRGDRNTNLFDNPPQ